MTRNVVFALTVTAGGAVAAFIAMRRRARRLEAAQHEADLQRWEDECGVPVQPIPKPLS